MSRKCEIVLFFVAVVVVFCFFFSLDLMLALFWSVVIEFKAIIYSKLPGRYLYKRSHSKNKHKKQQQKATGK